MLIIYWNQIGDHNDPIKKEDTTGDNDDGIEDNVEYVVIDSEDEDDYEYDEDY